MNLSRKMMKKLMNQKWNKIKKSKKNKKINKKIILIKIKQRKNKLVKRSEIIIFV